MTCTDSSSTLFIGEWIYFKVYVNPRISDIILMDVVCPFVRTLIKKGFCNKWFFTRYFDSGPHLRLRFHITARNKIEATVKDFKALLSPYSKMNYVWNLQPSIYKKEIERYSLENIDTVEDIFHTQSELAILLLTKKIKEEKRMAILCFIINNMLAHIGFSFEERHYFISEQREYFKSEFDIGKDEFKIISKEYRKQSFSIIEFVLKREVRPIPMDKDFESLLEKLTHSTVRIKLPKTKARKVYLLGSIFHMLVNKCFSYEQRAIEFLIYEFLDRAYLSCSHRKIDQ